MIRIEDYERYIGAEAVERIHKKAEPLRAGTSSTSARHTTAAAWRPSSRR